MKLRIKVIPGAQRTEVIGWMANGVLKVRVQAPPEKGKANEELVKYFAKQLRLSRSEISIIKGRGSREKTLGLPDIDMGEIEHLAATGKSRQ